VARTFKAGGEVVKPRLTVKQILTWADEYKTRIGRWPTAHSGPVVGAAGETWAAVSSALAKGYRGLPGGDSLSRLLQRERGVGRRGWHSRPWSMHRDTPPE
jgi:hypothetical protein